MNCRSLSSKLIRLTTGLNSAAWAAAAESKAYYTTTAATLVKRKSLYSKISPLGGKGTIVTPELDKWVETGKKLSVDELKRIVHDLRKRRRFSQALQVSEWMSDKGIFNFTTSEHAVHLDLIGKVHGFEVAESYFGKLKEEERNEKTYGALLNCYVRQGQVEKASSYFQKIKEMGFASALAYNSIMRLYNNLEQHDKVPGVLSDMISNDVIPDNYSYRNYITSYGEKGDIDGMEKALKEMERCDYIKMDWVTYAVVANFYLKASQKEKAIYALQKSEKWLAVGEDADGYNHLISLYSKLGSAADVLRLWDAEKQACKRYLNRDYINMLQSLVRLGEMEKAEKVLADWEISGNCYDARIPKLVIDGHTEKGLADKASS